ncbi:MAG TPA: peptidoglycan-associated lipoprotein Pal [Thermoanaerobaculia bacterium]|nr:peptidoglycan-associated lipoprotein Pal [Thermoanaerobaculia bacterium]
MRWRASSLFLFLAFTLVLTSGCRKQKPVTPADTIAETAPVAADATPVTSSPAAPVEEDEREDPLSGDLEALNAYLRSQGLLSDLYFDYDSSSLRTQERDQSSRNADFLRQQPQFLLTIEGHCDERGTNEYNLALGERRASAVRDYLVSLGVSSDRLRTISYGEERPVCTESDESCWQQNRRAHHVVTGRTGG